MPKMREKSEVEYLRAENKKMKAEIKSLKKTVSRFSKRSHQLEDLEERIVEQDLKEKEDDFIEVKPSNACPQCANGKVEVVNLGIRVITTCDCCEYREIKKGG